MTRLLAFSSALLLLLPGTALAKDKVPGLDELEASTQEVQLIGWSQDERRYALRVYDLQDLMGEEDPPPYCKGYVDHTGKKFRGGLSIVLYEGGKRIGSWRIQDWKCTPPEKSRERLAQAKAALVEQGIDLTATGVTLAPPEKSRPKPSEQEKGGTTLTTATTPVTLPHGPWAQKTVEILCRTETRIVGSEDEDMGKRTSTVAFTLRLGTGKDAIPLSELRLGPIEWWLNMAGFWSASFDRLFVSPSGKVLVALGSVHHGNMRISSTPRLLIGAVDLAERTQAVQVNAPAR
jgi:hypothetical protein